ncbi:proline dehydrogenase family protein [Lignipirellula cremea]|uniref:L-glutamate gamma-semialdehyde dehydrogenase n=1 Tax=Lignipirellula cremea TaxID=2528010 RepID=A0A518DR66_9BACT|nr:proline dehydrogenase family protein [Lignipirellula cremea]QDU94314.1 Bifunctional protein PutA [Lignipirellula cremea]
MPGSLPSGDVTPAGDAVAHDLARSCLRNFRPDPDSALEPRVQQALYLARALQERAVALQTPQERRQQAELDRMIHHPHDRVTLVQMTDQAFRSQRAGRAVDQLTHILDVQGVPRFFSPMDRTLLKGFQSFGNYLPGVAAPLVKEKMHQETANVVLPAEQEELARHLRARTEEGVRMNVNFLGEALLGEEDAEHRLQQYLQALQRPEIEVISVKISTIYSQISPLARQHTIDVLCDRLELLYRAALKSSFTRPDGETRPKFVYLDMEEYRDLSITAEAFMRTLDRPGLEQAIAGIALQAYVPDSFPTQQRITAWARQRVASGGSPVTIRIVKGANMEMERVDASLSGWPQAPYRTKIETDANYKRMLQAGLQPENLAAVRIGVASHNLFDVAYGMVLTIAAGGLEQVQFEMLEGMANHQRRALFELTDNMLLYAPACRQEDFLNAIGYLIRRLDENTGPSNFLRHAFKLHVDSPDWRRLEQQFIDSHQQQDDVSCEPRRTQDRRLPPAPAMPADADWRHFVNEPDTDFSLPRHGEWAADLVQRAKVETVEQPVAVPLVIAGESLPPGDDAATIRDPSRPGVSLGRLRLATAEEVDQAVACAAEDPDGWRQKTPAERLDVMRNVAQELRQARGRLLTTALADGGKTIGETDPEISEAIDFVEFYPRTAADFYALPKVDASPQGVAAVVSPWNFPIAIPCGGVAAALAAGNTVILKPATDTAWTAYELCQCFWRGGVSQRTLQFVPGSGSVAGARLTTHADVDVVILTGGTETALSMLKAKPEMNLLAETGGKNATIVTGLSDREQAIKHVVQSAFGHAGQKCSATSLLILEEEVFHDEGFQRTLCDAVESLPVGSAWELKHRMGPLIRPPAGDLEQALKVLEPGESWAVMPHRLEENPQLYSPGVKWNVQPGSVTHLTEFFGPVLGVMSAKNLEEAIELVNQTGFGLTSGLESLDDREQQTWSDQIRAGNLYINRGTTGAIVLRQPFGGMGKSAFGPGVKAGGPNYVAPLMRFQPAAEETSMVSVGKAELADPQLAAFRTALLAQIEQPGDLPADELRQVVASIEDYDRQMRDEFGRSHDHFRLVGQDNLRRYLAVDKLRIRVHPDDSVFELFARVAAARAAGCHIGLSYPAGFDSPAIALLDDLTFAWGAAIEFIEETDKQLAARIRERQTDRLRYAGKDRVPQAIRRAVADSGIYAADAPVLGCGRVELLWYLTEQSLCVDYHRYGNLGVRGDEERTEPQ